ncbi:MAG: hypothetical protein WBZ33_15905 [Thermoactinomyces sp.]
MNNMQKNSDWKDDWIVIADKGLDPFIFDKKTEKIYYTWHGQGSIHLREIAPNLVRFIEALIVLSEICYLKYDGQFLNDKWEFDRKILQEIEMKLGAIMPEECVRNWILILE